MKFYIDDFNKRKPKDKHEYKLHYSDGKVFFILKMKDNKYYTEQLDKYEPIKDKMRDWLVREIESSDNFLLLNDDYDYDKIIIPMFRDIKINKIIDYNKKN